MVTITNMLQVPTQLLDPAARIGKNTDQLNQVAKLFLTVVEAVNLHLQQPVLELATRAIKNVTEFVGSRQVFSTANELVSGEAASKNPISDSVPNVLRVASRSFMLVDNVCKTVGWLGAVGILNAAEIASQVASIPVFGLVGSLTLKTLGGYAGIVGTSLDLIDIARVVATKGFTVDSCLGIAGDIAKIFLSVITVTFVGAAPYTIILFGIVAASTASISSIAKFLIGEYYPKANSQPIGAPPANNPQDVPSAANEGDIGVTSNQVERSLSTLHTGVRGDVDLLSQAEGQALSRSTSDALNTLDRTAAEFVVSTTASTKNSSDAGSID